MTRISYDRPVVRELRPPPIRVAPVTTGERIRLLREARGMTRPVLAGLVGRSTDWLKKIETGTRQLNSLPLLVQIAQVLGVNDLAEITGYNEPTPVSAWDTEIHHVIPPIRTAMHEAAFRTPTADPVISALELQQDVRDLWVLWHTSPQQRSDVGARLPGVIRQAHRTIRAVDGDDRRRAKAATGDLYRLVQRLLAHICEPELHALAVERGRAMSEDADTPHSLALAAWSSSVSLCASGFYDDAARLADIGVDYLVPALRDGGATAQTWGTLGALQMEAAAAHGLAGRDGEAHHYLDAAHATAAQLPDGAWHEQSGFESTGVRILSVIVTSCLRRYGDALSQAEKIGLTASPSLVRSSRLLLEAADAQRHRTDYGASVQTLTRAADVSAEAVALIPWARELADDLAAHTTGKAGIDAARLAGRLKSVR